MDYKWKQSGSVHSSEMPVGFVWECKSCKTKTNELTLPLYWCKDCRNKEADKQLLAMIVGER